ncbi:GNAT family N-acetyltransferase [Caldisericum exile]|uniref:N-acetyltransferase domain-containing protein n=1 Tax=Caldisericum exile (strain DSM 21853 / NBRC 104410 / AZM16c01) TaxID=511051 RepID=A0A7U6GF00_CALEA|nr:GNAT family N-acetyltransferase [Caldisericum exile]BAL81160.1 hypothetical protein CSE_10340 [Caldisericum exile AZM16c01]
MLEIKKIYHYTLNLDKVKTFETNTKFEHAVYASLSEVKNEILNKLSFYFGEEKLNALKFRFAVQHKMVVTFIESEFASFCFFSDSPFKFSLFKLNKQELYFYDCFTFEKFRGLSSIYAEVKYVLDKYRNLGYKVAHVEIEENNTPSQNAFKKLGFRKVRIYYVISIFGLRIIFVKRVSS